MDFVENGPLMPENSRCQPLSEDRAWNYFRQLASALEYCHSHGVIHGDIKPSNLLLCEDKEKIKVSDFGASLVMGTVGGTSEARNGMFQTGQYNDKISRILGTSAFLSPESLEGDPFSGFLHDIWSSGVTLFFFLYGRCPFVGDSVADMLENVETQELEFPDEPDVSEAAKDLIQKMLERDVTKRIPIPDILSHPWVTKHGLHRMPSTSFSQIEVTEEECHKARQIRSSSSTSISAMGRAYAKLKRRAGEAQERLRTRSRDLGGSHVVPDNLAE
jgi:[calcium/calmodulin-dependent protein kinase] kinase